VNDRTMFRRADRVLWRSFAAEVLIAVPGRDDIDHLEGTAAAVWDELKAPRTATEVTDRLCLEFASPADVVGPDVEGLLKVLVQRGCIEVTR
jgi:hypothetical protein